MMVFIPGSPRACRRSPEHAGRRRVCGTASSYWWDVGYRPPSSWPRCWWGDSCWTVRTQPVATALLESLFSGPMLAAVGPALLAFFVGTAVFAIPLMRAGGEWAWRRRAILLGALLDSRRDRLRPGHSQPGRQCAGLLRQRDHRLADASPCTPEQSRSRCRLTDVVGISVLTRLVPASILSATNQHLHLEAPCIRPPRIASPSAGTRALLARPSRYR